MQLLQPLIKPFSTPAARITLGLVALLTCVVLLLDAGLSAFTSREGEAKHMRHRVGESVAAQMAALVQEVDTRTLNRAMERTIAQTREMKSMAMRRADGSLVSATAQHSKLWHNLAAGSATEVKLPIYYGKDLWGHAEFVYAPLSWQLPFGLMFDVPLLFTLSFLLWGGPAIYFFVRRVLVTLDPSAVVPARVRGAYDALTEGVVILDRSERVVLANQAFRDLHPEANREVNGKRLDDLAWLARALPKRNDKGAWWADADNPNEVAQGIALDISQPDGTLRKVILHATSVRDNRNYVKGTLLTFDDHTETEIANANLKKAVSELEASREEIREKNVQLELLANRDGLTGCFNRRAFFERAEAMFARAQATHTHFAVMMADVDHFKSFNDRFGHAVGDQVLQGVAQALAAAVPEEAVLGRYGGEEFAVAVVMDPRSALSLGEKLRKSIEDAGGKDVNMKVTASFGLASINNVSQTLSAVLERADQALYFAKESGRNRVAVDRRGDESIARRAKQREEHFEDVKAGTKSQFESSQQFEDSRQ